MGDRVLKPPGGGSSDIFGPQPEETSPRRVKNHNQSQLGSALFGDATDSANENAKAGTGNNSTTNKPGNDSYNRLFGPPDAPLVTPKNHMRSNINLHGDADNVATAGVVVNGTDTIGASNDFAAFRRNKRFRSSGFSCMPRNPVTGDGVDITPIRRSARKCRDGNPVTGTGYTDSQNTNSTIQNGRSSSNSSIGEKSSDSSPTGKVRTRVPPGGYSSGLW